MSTTAQNIAVQNVNRPFIAQPSAEQRPGNSGSGFNAQPMQSSLFFVQRTGVIRSASNDVWRASITILGPLM